MHDVFFIWTEGENKLESSLQCLNTFHPNIKFTHAKFKTSANFLDVAVEINGHKFDYIRRHCHLKNILRVYVLGLGNAFTPRNVLTINLES